MARSRTKKASATAAEPGGALRQLLRPDAENAHAISQVAARGLDGSMREFGDIGGITFNVQLDALIAGHARLARLEEAGAQVVTGPDGRPVTDLRPWVERAGLYVEDPRTRERFAVRVVAWPPERHRAAQLAANNPEIAGVFTERALPQLEALRDLPAFADLRLDALVLELSPPPAPDAQAPDVSSAALRTFSFVLTEEDGAVVDRAFARLREGAPGGTPDAVLFAQAMRAVTEAP